MTAIGWSIINRRKTIRWWILCKNVGGSN